MVLKNRNFKLLTRLPIGFTTVATLQTNGRGRGQNVWVSPRGNILFSLAFQHPMSTPTLAPVTFVQYIMSVAIASACRSYGPGYSSIPVRLKWPNDIYARNPTQGGGEPEYLKIGGILVNSSYLQDNFHLVVGVGINLVPRAPTTSLNALIDAHNRTSGLTPLPHYCLERLMALILVRFESLYHAFLRQGVDAWFDEYYQYWLHSNAIVTLDMEGGTKACISGITRDYGMLVAEEVGTGRKIELQSDSNSFDFFKGLVRRKI